MELLKPSVCVLKAPGSNCDQETARAYELAGGNPQIVPLNDLLFDEERLDKYQILALPGGFSFGDHIASGSIMANELRTRLVDQVSEFCQKNKLILGICNGFQILVQTGILPSGRADQPIQAALEHNASGQFECRWINLASEKDNACVFLSGLDIKTPMQVAHGEGNFYTTPKTLRQIESDNLVVFRYVDQNGIPTQNYPENPNGALNSIAGITDKSGKILGIMPHPERFVYKWQYPNRSRGEIEPYGLKIFQGMVQYAQQS